MDDNNYGSGYHLFNLIGSICIFGLGVAIILLIDSKYIFLGKICPIIILAIILIILGALWSKLISRKYRYSWVRSLKKKYHDENESYNLYKVDPKLAEKGLNDYEYHSLVKFRILNFFLFLLSALMLIFGLVDLKGFLLHDVILPIIMIISGLGIFFVTIDFIAESIVKLHFRRHKDKYDKKEYHPKDTIFNKNLRIYYIPISIFVGIILVMIVVDFSKSIIEIARPIIIITFVWIFVCVGIDFIISKIINSFKVLNEEANTIIDNDISDEIENELQNEKEHDNNEV